MGGLFHKSIPDLESVKTGWLKAEMVMGTNILSYIDDGPHQVSFLIMTKGNLATYVMRFVPMLISKQLVAMLCHFRTSKMVQISHGILFCK